jgi:hypothetical protein
MAKKKKVGPKYQVWIDARSQFRLSHAHIQMARELGMNPKKLGKLASNKQEPWKSPLPVFIEDLYFKHFGKRRPDTVRSIEQLADDKRKKQLERKARKAAERQAEQASASVPEVTESTADEGEDDSSF